jgi:asparagine synthase (glutamine-hydrolysing)
MSGIAGVIHFDGAPIEPGHLERLTNAMAHRGPDGIRHWVAGSVALGHCMLRTTPESLDEDQPLANEDQSLILVMDGRVDNWEELRRELIQQGAVLRDHSDAELVLRAYQVWGRDCLKHVDGDFALAIWDAQRKEAFCARDRIGNKPFNYYWNGKTLVFASELHAILTLPWVAQTPNDGMLAEFLAAEWYSREETLWAGVLRLVAAHLMIVGSSGPHPRKYWQPDLGESLPFSKDEDYILHYRELLTDCVRRMSRSHRPVAYEVSGGLDSSSVFCVAEHLRRTNELPAPGIEGYTLAFTDNSAANELAYARAVADHTSVPLCELPPSIMPLSWYADSARALQDFPGFPNGSMFVDIRKEASSRGCRVTLHGEGGDQWLEGARTYYAEELAHCDLRALYDCMKADAKVYGVVQPAAWFFRHGCVHLLPSAVQKPLRAAVRKLRRDTRVPYWLSPAMRKKLALRRRQYRAADDQRVNNLGQRALLRRLDDAFTAQFMERDERQAARFAMEMRSPFLSQRFVQFAISTPERLRLRGDRTKYIHVQALRGVMPAMILERRSKAEFSTVFRGHLAALKTTLVETAPAERPEWLVPDGMERLYRAYEENPQAGWHMWILWAIFGCDRLMP